MIALGIWKYQWSFRVILQSEKSGGIDITSPRTPRAHHHRAKFAVNGKGHTMMFHLTASKSFTCLRS
jgi:hypothetical protein